MLLVTLSQLLSRLACECWGTEHWLPNASPCERLIAHVLGSALLSSLDRYVLILVMPGSSPSSPLVSVRGWKSQSYL